ncbi:hypothetical protein OsJ_28008 [Oryza sativa Japonica Group]|uniref:Glucan endo-1,3-beta-D-glucosidase n=1 Tax=Oryza sativa subsp. japonica TaxID=39947 RepID=A3BV14_ORYSJ|nr:hypothetical protein OsJ_28008 [Oryza sativa Japonica Group]
MSSSSLAAAAAAAFLLAVAMSCHCHVARGWGGLGVNYGTVADDLPTAARSVELLRAAGAGAVRIYDANADILRALAGTGVPVSVTVLSDRATAGTAWPSLVPAMANLRRALSARGLGRVKVGTTLAMDALGTSYPPSAGAFRDDIAGAVVRPLLEFLNATGSYYFVDAYPYFAWAANHRSISLDYALFQGEASTHYVDPGTGLTYTNLFDQMLDAVVAAMARLGYGNVKLAVSETGWPTAGDADELARTSTTPPPTTATSPRGWPRTPARRRGPGAEIPVFLFSLYNENRKPGPGNERHWGL